MSPGWQLAEVLGAAVVVGVVLQLFPRVGGYLLLIVVLMMVLVAGSRHGLWQARGL